MNDEMNKEQCNIQKRRFCKSDIPNTSNKSPRRELQNKLCQTDLHENTHTRNKSCEFSCNCPDSCYSSPYDSRRSSILYSSFGYHSPSHGSSVNMTEFAFNALVFRTSLGYESIPIHIPDSRNFISPPWPDRFWARPVFTNDETSTKIRLAAVAARNTAAVAAIENLQTIVNDNIHDTDRRLRPLERRIKETANALEDFEKAAAVAEATDAAADISSAESQNYANDVIQDRCNDTSENQIREVQIVKNDPKLRYDTNLSLDMLAVVYASKGSGSSGISVGPWYRILQDTLITERPIASRRIDYQNGRMSRTFVSTAVSALQSCGRLYVGNRHYTAFEAAALCLFVYSSSTSGLAKQKPPGSFTGILVDLSVYLNELSQAISLSGSRPNYTFDSSLSQKPFAASGTGRYERNSLMSHSIITALIESRSLPPVPGTLPKEGLSSEIDAFGDSYDDPVNRAAAALLGRAQPLFLMEDQTLLRSCINTLTSLLLIRRLLWNTNVYSDRILNSFQLGSLLPTTIGEQLTVGANGSIPKDAIKSDDRNFGFLVRNYIMPLYANDHSLEITQMFPGLVAISLEASVGGIGPYSTRNTRRRVLDISTNRSHTNLVKLIALELENRSKTNITSVRDVIESHDAVTIQYERGIAAAIIYPRLKDTFFQSGKAAVFNVSSDYDLHYFLCLGYIPKFMSAI